MNCSACAVESAHLTSLTACGRTDAVNLPEMWICKQKVSGQSSAASHMTTSTVCPVWHLAKVPVRHEHVYYIFVLDRHWILWLMKCASSFLVPPSAPSRLRGTCTRWFLLLMSFHAVGPLRAQSLGGNMICCRAFAKAMYIDISKAKW